MKITIDTIEGRPCLTFTEVGSEGEVEESRVFYDSYDECLEILGTMVAQGSHTRLAKKAGFAAVKAAAQEAIDNFKANTLPNTN